LATALHQRWQHPTQEHKLHLGGLLWQEMRTTRLGDLLPESAIDELYTALMTEAFTRALYRTLPQDRMLEDLKRVHGADITLAEVLGPEATRLLKAEAQRPWKPNRALLEELLDQPLLRQALGNMVQKAIRQFLSSVKPIGSSAREAARGSVLGTLGRGLAHRAEKAAQIGKTFMEGVGGGLYRQVEAQLQPFLAGFMSRSVQLLTEGLFEGGKSGMGTEARVRILETILESPLHRLMPEPDPVGLARRLKIGEAVSAHLAAKSDYRDAIREVVHDLYQDVQDVPLEEHLKRLELPLEIEPGFQEALGQMAYHHLSRASTLRFLEAELEAVMS